MRRALLYTALLITGASGFAYGQFAPAGTGGVAALADDLRRLGATKRVLVIGAHPDDEDTQLLAYLSRGLGVDAAYLSLTRGEGGQNVIGEELGPELGIIRSEELLAARRLDGAHQFFTRAYDFGFSKNIDEAFRFWPRDSVLKDVIDVIRRFRPQVIVSIFTGTPRDGHGQHQVAGAVARQAFDLLKDSSWGPVKFYRSSFFDTAGTTLRMAAGTLDPLVGESYFQIAMAGRSQHRSQDMGQIQRPGPSQIRLTLVDSRNRAAGSDGFFTGVDTTLKAQDAYVALVDSARRRLSPYDPGAVVPFLARGLQALGTGDPDQRALAENALADAAGVVVDGIADDDIVIRGERVQVEADVWNAGGDSVRLTGIDFSVPPGWSVDAMETGGAGVSSGSVVQRHFAVHVPVDAPRSQPYFLERPLNGALYDWSGVPADVRGLPFGPPPVSLRVHLVIDGAPVTLTRQVVYRFRDQARGEVRRPLMVTEPFEVSVTPGLVVWPQTAGGSRQFTVLVTNRNRGPATGRLDITVPSGWAPVPSDSLSFAREDETKSYTFTVDLPANTKAGDFRLRASVRGSDRSNSDGALVVIDYPHIEPRAVVHPSVVDIKVAPIALPALSRIGYIRGASDRVPEALTAVGLPIEVLSADTLAKGNLSRFDAIVIGSRAYETDPALVANNGRLLDYARAGGLIVVQYQQYPFIRGGFAPYPMSIASPHDRVTDENALVTVTDTSTRVLKSPNPIGPSDWQGWVQERGLYFAHDWDSTYHPVFTMHDPGDPPLAGGLLVAPLGRGTYVYTGLSFFRELPAGVIGAYRLFANLLALKATQTP
ncbi:MAG TPA: PIG-L family deacetylase [Gemmatimonadales bacterium]|nr:PIG-L family deacetylase [Gemmatimonadales bacterium]